MKIFFQHIVFMKSKTCITQNKPSMISSELAQLASRLQEVHRRAESAGLFIEDRPLLQCPRCGLMEDVGFDGRLMTYLRTHLTRRRAVTEHFM